MKISIIKENEIPAGMVAIPFYKKMGYDFKNGELNFSDGHFAMENSIQIMLKKHILIII